MRTGLMRRKVTIRTMTRTPDGMGGGTETPTDVENVDARIRPLQGDELVQAMQTGMRRPHEFTIRYRPGITGATQIVYDGRTFDIKSPVDTEERRRELVIMTEEVDA